MIDFFYDSLETLKTVKVPTTSELLQFTAVVFVVLVISGLLFIGLDIVASNLYEAFYQMMMS